MSPFSKVEMSPFVIVKQQLPHERDRESEPTTSDEQTGANPPGSNPTSEAKDVATTTSRRAIVAVSASGKAVVQSLPGIWSRGVDFKAARSSFKQSFT